MSEIVSNLESQLEQKCQNEMAITKELKEMKSTIDDRDAKMRLLLSELEMLRNERNEDSLAVCLKCAQEAEVADNFEEIIKEQVSTNCIFCMFFFLKMYHTYMQLHLGPFPRKGFPNNIPIKASLPQLCNFSPFFVQCG